MCFSIFSTIPRPPRAPLFPYTTLFRSQRGRGDRGLAADRAGERVAHHPAAGRDEDQEEGAERLGEEPRGLAHVDALGGGRGDRKSTRLNSSHMSISYAVFCLKKKNNSYLWLSPCQYCCVPHSSFQSIVSDYRVIVCLSVALRPSLFSRLE